MGVCCLLAQKKYHISQKHLEDVERVTFPRVRTFEKVTPGRGGHPTAAGRPYKLRSDNARFSKIQKRMTEIKALFTLALVIALGGFASLFCHSCIPTRVPRLLKLFRMGLCLMLQRCADDEWISFVQKAKKCIRMAQGIDPE